MRIDYSVIRCDCRSIGLEIRGGELVVRTPRTAIQADIECTLEEGMDLKHLWRAAGKRMCRPQPFGR